MIRTRGDRNDWGGSEKQGRRGVRAGIKGRPTPEAGFGLINEIEM